MIKIIILISRFDMITRSNTNTSGPLEENTEGLSVSMCHMYNFTDNLCFSRANVMYLIEIRLKAYLDPLALQSRSHSFNIHFCLFVVSPLSTMFYYIG